MAAQAQTSGDLQDVSALFQRVVTGDQISAVILQGVPHAAAPRVSAVLDMPPIREALDRLAFDVGRGSGKARPWYTWLDTWGWVLYALPQEIRRDARRVLFDVPEDASPSTRGVFLTRSIGEAERYAAAWQPMTVDIEIAGDTGLHLQLTAGRAGASTPRATPESVLTVRVPHGGGSEAKRRAARAVYRLQHHAANSVGGPWAIGLDVGSVAGLADATGLSRARLCDDIAKSLRKDSRIKGRGESRVVRLPDETRRYMEDGGTTIPASYGQTKLGNLTDDALSGLWWQLFVPWEEVRTQLDGTGDLARVAAAKAEAKAARAAAARAKRAQIDAPVQAAIDALGELPDLTQPSPGDLPRATPDEIPLDVARAAFRGTSFAADRRGDDIRVSYAASFNAAVDSVAKYATTADRIAYAADALGSLKARYRAAVLAWLSRHSSVTSWAITGRGGRNERREAKKGDSADRALEESSRVLREGTAAIIAGIRAVRIAERGGATGDLARRIQAAEEAQASMKAANRIVRGKGTEAHKRTQLASLGFDEQSITSLLTPDRGRPGFEAYQLTNNNANIKRMKVQLATLDKRAMVSRELAGGQGDAYDYDSAGYDFTAPDGTRVNVEIDPDAERVRLSFPKSAEDFRAAVKARGFAFSRRNSAWQRKNTMATFATVAQLLGIGHDAQDLIDAIEERRQ